MLLSLTLSEFVIVPRLSLELDSGFTTLTGETGAGKSILIDALQFLLGARADTIVIREGASKTEVCGIFSMPPACSEWLEENGFDAGEKEILLRRTLDLRGRSRAWINGSPATANQMRSLGERLVDIHGQHANQSLLKPSEQLRLLDNHGGLNQHRLEVRSFYSAWQDSKTALDSARKRIAGLQEEFERLSWMKEDLDALAPEEDEWSKISEEHTKLANASALRDGANEALALLSDDDASAGALIGKAYQALESLTRYDPKLENLVQQLSDAASIVSDAASTISAYLDSSDLDEEQFAEVDRRLSAFYDTARKFHVSPDKLSEVRARVNHQLAELSSGIDITNLESAEKEARFAYMQAARALSSSRKRAAASLSRRVTAAMQKLSMEGGSLDIVLSACDPGPSGLDHCEFLVAGHAGVTPRNLSKVASGGELSRISLAIAVITSRATPVSTLIFDEVDAGIGGAVAEVVGRLLQRLGADRQVLCVTHQPQVACCASSHLHVEKETIGNTTTSTVRRLNSKDRVQEIARMLGGIKLTQATLDHAREMLETSTPSENEIKETNEP